MRKKTLWIILMLLVGISSIGSFIYIKFPLFIPVTMEKQPMKHSIEVLGFVPYWSVREKIPQLDYIALFALEPKEGQWKNLFGKIPNIPQNTKVLWTLKIHKEDDDRWLNTHESISEMIEKLSYYISAVDGVVINLENWDKYFKLDDIAETFHKLYPDKILMVTLPSWGLPITSNLYSISDRFILMTYDYDPENGVLAPLKDVENSIRFYQYLSDKLLLGIPLYGYQQTQNGYIAIPIKKIEKLPKHYSNKGETITKLPSGYIVWNDINIIKKKVTLTRKYHLKGIALWAIGYSSDQFINNLLKAVKPISATTYPP